jgi:carbonic anhydrase
MIDLWAQKNYMECSMSLHSLKEAIELMPGINNVMHWNGVVSFDPPVPSELERDPQARKEPNKEVFVGPNILKKHQPKWVILCCSDARLGPELIFRQNKKPLQIGDAFIVRTLGHTLGPSVTGSIECAVKMGAKELIIMGHTHCEAVENAMNKNLHTTSGSPLGKIYQSIRNRIKQYMPFSKDAVSLKELAHINTYMTFRELMSESPCLRSHFKAKKLNVYAGVFDMDAFSAKDQLILDVFEKPPTRSVTKNSVTSRVTAAPSNGTRTAVSATSHRTEASSTSHQTAATSTKTSNQMTGAGWLKKPDCFWAAGKFRGDNHLSGNFVKTDTEYCRTDSGEAIRSGRYRNAETGESVP